MLTRTENSAITKRPLKSAQRFCVARDQTGKKRGRATFSSRAAAASVAESAGNLVDSVGEFSSRFPPERRGDGVQDLAARHPPLRRPRTPPEVQGLRQLRQVSLVRWLELK